MDVEFFHSTICRELIRSLCKVTNCMTPTVNCSFPCPASVAALLVNELGQLWSSKEKQNPLFRSGWDCAAEKSIVVEARMSNKDLALFLSFTEEEAEAFDGRIYFSRRWRDGRMARKFFEFASLTKCRRLADGSRPVAAVSYTHETETLNIRLKPTVTGDHSIVSSAPDEPVWCALDFDRLM